LYSRCQRSKRACCCSMLGSWLCSLLLEREMHPLVPAILLGMAGLDAFEADAKPEPPDREFAESVERVC